MSGPVPTADPEPGRRHVFISYARADGRGMADRLFQALAARNIPGWRDERSIDPNQDFSVEIENAIEGATHVVVCLTPSIHGRDSFVRREILYAQQKSKPIIPLLAPEFSKDNVPITVNHLTWIDFARFDDGFTALVARLEKAPEAYQAPPAESDAFRSHVERLNLFVVERLRETVFALGEVLQLQGADAPGAVKRPYESRRIAWFTDTGSSAKPREFGSVPDALAHYHGRLLLLGEPGSGKTTISWALIRDKTNERLADPAALLPVYAEISNWDGKTGLIEWLARETELDPAELARQVEAGRALLVLDGLDEMPDSAEDPDNPGGPRRDYRVAFLEMLWQAPRTPVVVTCRVQDYEAIVEKYGRKAALNGAITLRPLTDGQIEAFLGTGRELWSVLRSDDNLREIARTPLLLTLLAIGYQDAAAEAGALKAVAHSFAELRDRIFENYVQKRYQFEEARSAEGFPCTLDRLYDALGGASLYLLNYRKRIRFRISRKGGSSLRTSSGGWEPATSVELPARAMRLLLGPDAATVIHAAQVLKLLIPSGAGSLRFMHALVRDHFATRYCSAHLGDRDPNIRARAAGGLGLLGDRRPVAALVAAVRDPDPLVRAIATWSLGEIRHDSAVQAIGAVLDDELLLRSVAIGALGNIGGEAAAKLVISALRKKTDFPSIVFSAATDAFAKMGEPAVPPVLDLLKDRDVGIRLTAAEALHRIGDARAVEPLIGAVAYTGSWFDRLLHSTPILSEEDDVRRAAARALGKSGDLRAVEPLIAALRDPAAEVREAAGEALGRLNDSRAAEPLLVVLRDKQPAVRAAAAAALGEICDAGSTPALIAALDDSDAEVRYRSAQALGAIGDLSAMSPLMLALSHPPAGLRPRAAGSLGWDRRSVEELMEDELSAGPADDADKLRAASARALGAIGDPRANPLLIAALADGDAMTRRNAAWALGRIEDARAASILRPEIGDFPAALREPLLEILFPPPDAAAVDALIAALRDQSGDVRATAAMALGKIKDQRAVEPLIHTLQDADPVARSFAARALASIEDPRARESLETALADSEGEVRLYSAMALGTIGDGRAAEPLRLATRDAISAVRRAALESLGQLGAAAAVEAALNALSDPEPSVRFAAAAVLGRTGDGRAVDSLSEALAGEDDRIRRLAAEALAEIDTPAALDRLKDLFEDADDEVRETAAVAVGKRDGPTVDRLLGALAHSDDGLQATAVAALGQLGDRRAVEPLLTLLQTGEAQLRNPAATALGRIGDPRAVEPLWDALHDSDPEVSDSAALALGRLGDARALEPLTASLRRFHDDMRSEIGRVADPQP